MFVTISKILASFRGYEAPYTRYWGWKLVAIIFAILAYRLNQGLPHPDGIIEYAKFIFYNVQGIAFWVFVANLITAIICFIVGSNTIIFGFGFLTEEYRWFIWLPVMIWGVGIVVFGLYYIGVFIKLLIAFGIIAGFVFGVLWLFFGGHRN